MPFIEVKATDKSGGLFKSKAAMKRAYEADANGVTFESVQGLGPRFYGHADNVPAGTTLVVVGPDPERARNWYGNVKLVKGVIKIT